MLSLIIQLSFFALLTGWAATLWISVRSKRYGELLLLIFVPFYAIRYILRLEDSKAGMGKKYLSILVMGGLILFFFSFILELVLTPSF